MLRVLRAAARPALQACGPPGQRPHADDAAGGDAGARGAAAAHDGAGHGAPGRVRRCAYSYPYAFTRLHCFANRLACVCTAAAPVAPPRTPRAVGMPLWAVHAGWLMRWMCSPGMTRPWTTVKRTTRTGQRRSCPGSRWLPQLRRPIGLCPALPGGWAHGPGTHMPPAPAPTVHPPPAAWCSQVFTCPELQQALPAAMPAGRRYMVWGSSSGWLCFFGHIVFGWPTTG